MIVCLLDNGAGKLKAGVCRDGSNSDNMLQVKHSNCTSRVLKQMNTLVGDQVDSTFNGSLLQYTRPFDRGYLVNWTSELEIWTRLFGANGVNITPSESSLCLTEAPFAPEAVQNDTNEIVFEEYSFQHCLRKPAAWYSAYELARNPPEGFSDTSSCTVVDSGFSFTYVMPFLDGKCQKFACKRVNVGGKLLTNYLKEVVSYRQWNMMDEFKIIDQVKEDLCYISTDFRTELSRSKRKGGDPPLDAFGGKLKKFFALPDYQQIMRGFAKEDDEDVGAEEQILSMETERFSVPEVLFHPSDVGVNQAGVAESTWQSLQCLDPIEMGLSAANIVLTGGNVKFKNFESRFLSEIRPFVPDVFPVNVHTPFEPDNFAFRGMSRYIQQEQQSNTLKGQMVSRAEYLERGHYHCNKRFYDSW